MKLQIFLPKQANMNNQICQYSYLILLTSQKGFLNLISMNVWDHFLSYQRHQNKMNTTLGFRSWTIRQDKVWRWKQSTRSTTTQRLIGIICSKFSKRIEGLLLFGSLNVYLRRIWNNIRGQFARQPGILLIASNVLVFRVPKITDGCIQIFSSGNLARLQKLRGQMERWYN